MISVQLRRKLAKVPEEAREPELHEKLEEHADFLQDLEQTISDAQAETEGTVTIDGFELVLSEAVDLAEWCFDHDAYAETAGLLLGWAAGLSNAQKVEVQ